MPERTTGKRSHRVIGGACAALVLLGVTAYAVTQSGEDRDRRGPPRCSVAGPDGERAFTLRPEQAASAATIGAVASARGLPERAVTIAIATAMQESSLRNIDYGDRDSLGLFQQRPSMGWGSEAEVMDPVYAAGAFYDRLVDVPGYLTLPLTVAAQEVQRSAFPDAYARHEEEAALLAGALTGRAEAALSCSWTVAEQPAGQPREVHERMMREFGEGVQPIGEGARLTVPLRGGEETRRGWELAHWAVAHSAELGIERISYGNRVWEARRSGDGWQEAAAESMAGAPELRLSVFAPAEPIP
ncbi:hypothetical protein RM779_11215 [Streptomyces sp. DSM 41886]|uniref:ARB-07466-like C-terminal domain-containing protein n=1 Tax=Streptomyces johnsoniae TaxID=3075532 RepID=A0ABU2S2F5_9ACTN|nr:hypothetical protein [Streptomyces sp. DSM 41886]MDT0443162.1 hypothetical protein [Streptomyces sp. DSM 41886]